MFEKVICTIQSFQKDKCKDSLKCDNINDFVHVVKKLMTFEKFGSKTFFIVMDRCERLHDIDENLLPAFMRLNELTRCKISVVFISEIIFDKFRQGTGLREPYKVHFPNYSKKELLEIMTLDAPDDHPKEFYHNYCKLLLSVFYNVCQDLKELRHLVLDMFIPF